MRRRLAFHLRATPGDTTYNFSPECHAGYDLGGVGDLTAA